MFYEDMSTEPGTSSSEASKSISIADLYKLMDTNYKMIDGKVKDLTNLAQTPLGRDETSCQVIQRSHKLKSLYQHYNFFSWVKIKYIFRYDNLD